MKKVRLSHAQVYELERCFTGLPSLDTDEAAGFPGFSPLEPNSLLTLNSGSAVKQLLV